MGCDIHLYTEALQSINGQLMWFNVDNWRLNKYCDPAEPSGEDQYRLKSVWDERNYYLFAVLANVRNRDNTVPIAEPRGLPKDVSIIVQQESDGWSSDGHSHSWLTLPEIIAYAKDNADVKASGLITQEDSARLDAGILPTSWCQGSTNTSLVRREWMMPNRSLIALIERLEGRAMEEFWVWRPEDLTDEIRAKIRIVFWFDN